ncbi:MAG TPA: HAD-IC family P-type ATPase, partial [Microthrixaceae bacterium]|nr:HAD-IC family P-type ATPase [Microthrixaceae bacterium]
VQELRAKRTLDKLALLSAPRALIVRDGAVQDMAVNEIVLDDIVELQPGHQIVADAIISVTSNLEVDESMLTGESEPVVKQPGDEVMSGSFVVAGSGRAQVHKVGTEAYAVKLAEEARRFTLAKSELRASVDKIISWVSWALIPTGAVVLWSSLRNDHHTLRESLVTTVGAVVAMVPEGLILLTTVAFAVGVVRLASRRTLVQELPAIEILARVDVICLDKTGTITSGEMELSEVRHVSSNLSDSGSSSQDHSGEAEMLDALAAIAWSDPNPNGTQLALQGRFDSPPDGWNEIASIPFSSARKWSASEFDGHGSWVIGAPEMVLEVQPPEVASQIRTEAAAGRRVLALARSDSPLDGEALPNGLELEAIIMIEDQVRPDAPETLRYFIDEDVTVKVISGDNTTTVSAVAARAGLPDADNTVDASTLPTDPEELADTVVAGTVFGRVTPRQKRAMVAGLQSRGHTVAMTGDGVNDVLALKDADIGIAMASGSEAARSVAQLVLLDSNFSGLPQVVHEGRRVINNLQLVASLFLTKTTYAILIALVVGVSGIPYPFLPRHLTLIGTLTIGVPAFFLAFAPNSERIRGNFFRSVALVALPSGIVASTVTLIGYVWARSQSSFSVEQQQTMAALVLTGVGMVVLIRTARPFVLWKGLLVGSMGALVLAAIVTPLGRSFFELHLPPSNGLLVALGLVGAAAVALVFARDVLERIVGPGWETDNLPA